MTNIALVATALLTTFLAHAVADPLPSVEVSSTMKDGVLELRVPLVRSCATVLLKPASQY